MVWVLHCSLPWLLANKGHFSVLFATYWDDKCCPLNRINVHSIIKKKKTHSGKTNQLLHTNPPYQLQASDPSVKSLHLMHGNRLPPRKPTQPLGHSIRKLFVVMVWNLSVYNFPNYLGETNQSFWYYRFSLDLSSDNQFCSPL